ncbi:DUF6344 domain-containing protein [Streptomyces sp. NPDC004065]|uniref:DUF6344 domain-containing protein n=1 Tax=Streptomyces sp. NPDC004065 TaxID=3364689 RepID=UPI00384B4F89
MDQHKVMKLWTAIVTAFLALCTALGLCTTNAAAATAAPQPETAPKSTSTARVPAQMTYQHPWSRSHTRFLPPTMKQRIRAEAHGKTPGCRHRAPADASPLATDPDCAPPAPPVRPTIPLQR